MKTVFVVILKTESGDEYQWVLTSRPSEEQVLKLFQRDIPEEVGDSLDDPWGYAQSWQIEELELEDL